MIFSVSFKIQWNLNLLMVPALQYYSWASQISTKSIMSSTTSIELPMWEEVRHVLLIKSRGKYKAYKIVQEEYSDKHGKILHKNKNMWMLSVRIGHTKWNYGRQEANNLQHGRHMVVCLAGQNALSWSRILLGPSHLFRNNYLMLPCKAVKHQMRSIITAP